MNKMKNIVKFSIALFFMVHLNSSAQQMVQTTADVYKLEKNQAVFIL